MRLLIRILNHPLFRRRNRIWYGNLINLKSKRRIPRQNHGNFLSCPITQSIWHSRWTIQRHLIRPLIGWKRRWMHGYWQWSLIWYLLQNLKINNPNLWRLEPLSFRCYVRSNLLFKIPRSIELWFEKISRQLNPIPQITLLHDRIRPIDLKRIIIIQSLNSPRINLINVRC